MLSLARHLQQGRATPRVGVRRQMLDAVKLEARIGIVDLQVFERPSAPVRAAGIALEHEGAAPRKRRTSWRDTSSSTADRAVCRLTPNSAMISPSVGSCEPRR